MKNKFGALAIVGIIFSTIGLVVMIISAVFVYRDYKNYNKYSEGKIELKEDLDYDFIFDNGNITFHNSELEYSYIDYKIIDLFTFEVNSANVKFTSRVNLFASFANKNTIDVYLADNVIDNYLKITLNAGELTADEISCKSCDLKVNAGKVNTNIFVEEKLNINMNAGELKMESSVAPTLNASLNAGKLNIKSEFNTLDFKVNAGEFNLTCDDSKDNYTINVKKNAGSSNVSNGGSGSKRIDGKINAGKFNVTFLGA